MSPSKILIPVDGSPASLRAVDFAIEMVGQDPSTSLVLLNVQNIPAIELAGASEASDTDWLREAGSRASAKALKDAIGLRSCKVRGQKRKNMWIISSLSQGCIHA
jgi:nucleotide-binding universal stress UspA family protein